MNGDELKDRVKNEAQRDPARAYLRVCPELVLRKDSGNGLKACCPLHNESEPSFTISTKGGRSGRYKCFGCGAEGDIVDLAQALGGRTFPEALEHLAGLLGIAAPPPAKRKANSPPLGEPAARWTVYHLSGAAFQHIRYEPPDAPKEFRWYDPTADKFTLGDKPETEMLLYGTEDVPADADLVVAVEGEKTRDALASRGIHAVAFFGNTHRPCDEVLKRIPGAELVLWADNDEPGRQLMAWAGAQLTRLGRRPRVLHWPEAPPKGDAADYTGPNEQLAELIAAALLWQPEPEAVGPEFTPSDLGNARRLVAQHGEDLRYCYPARSWYWWDGVRWQPDRTGEADSRAKQTVASMYLEAAQAPGKEARTALAEYALKSESDAKRKAMLSSAQSEPGVPILPDAFDTNLWLLNCLNGTVDLRTAHLEPHRREDYCTQLAPVEYALEAECPLWMSFLDRVTAGNRELQTFLRRAAGYSLTGVTAEQCLFLLYGTGANGKTTFVETLKALLGEYAHIGEFETFLLKHGDPGPRNDVAALAGKRLVVAVEPEADRRLAESLVKRMTGDDSVRARFLYQEGFDFEPQFKLWLAGNHKPVIRGTDYAIWRRIHLLPFTVVIPPEERDLQLKQKLRAELPGILNWALEGCLEWQSDGLRPPPLVADATQAYREESDVLAGFLGDCTVAYKTAEVTAKNLFAAYARWCEENAERPISQQALGRRLTELGYHRARGTGGAYRWHGIGLKSVE